MLRVQVPTPPTLSPVRDVLVMPAGDSVLDWLTAIGTVGALVVALWLGFHEVDRYRRENDERKQRALRGQAEAVTAWVDPETPSPMTTHILVGAPSRSGTVLNSSDQPIYNVAVSAPSVSKSLGFVPPHGQVHFPGPAVKESVAVTVRFSDAAGRWWRRNEEGVLEEIDTTATF